MGIQLKKAPAMTEPTSVKPAISRNLLITLGPRLFVLGSLMVPPGLAGDLQACAGNSFYVCSNRTQMVLLISCRRFNRAQSTALSDGAMADVDLGKRSCHNAASPRE